jgi:hypothetical protein
VLFFGFLTPGISTLGTISVKGSIVKVLVTSKIEHERGESALEKSTKYNERDS